MKLNHLALWTRDLETAADFWRKYFSAEIGDRYDSKNRPGFSSRFVNLPGEVIRFEIMEGPWVTMHPGEACGWAHIAFSVGTSARVDEIAERFRGDGLLVSAPRMTGDGHYEAVVRSPDGALIEIVE